MIAFSSPMAKRMRFWFPVAFASAKELMASARFCFVMVFVMGHGASLVKCNGAVVMEGKCHWRGDVNRVQGHPL